MKNTLHLILILTCCLVFTNSICTFAQDWPQWLGTNRDGKVEGFIAPDLWPAELDQQWKVDVGLGDSTPALVDDRLYVFALEDSKEVILCLDAANGEEIWRDDYFVSTLSGPSAIEHSGPRSSPAVGEGKVVNVGVFGIFSCNDITDGKLLWRKDIYRGYWPDHYTASSPIIVDGMAIAHLGKAGNGGIVALDLNTGEQKWKWDDDGPAYSSPVLMTVDNIKQIVQMTERNIVGINVADGTLLWKIPFLPTGLREFNVATVIIDGTIVIFTGVGRGTKAVKIEKQADGFVPVDLWSNLELNPSYTTPVLYNGLLFGMSERGKLYCLGAKTGKEYWKNGETLNPYGFGAIITTDSYLMASYGCDEMLVFEPDLRKFVELKRYNIADTKVYSYPVVSGNRLFIKDTESLSLWLFE